MQLHIRVHGELYRSLAALAKAMDLPVATLTSVILQAEVKRIVGIWRREGSFHQPHPLSQLYVPQRKPLDQPEHQARQLKLSVNEEMLAALDEYLGAVLAGEGIPRPDGYDAYLALPPPARKRAPGSAACRGYEARYLRLKRELFTDCIHRYCLQNGESGSK